MKTYLLLFFVLFCSFISSQIKIIDSLEKIIYNKTIPDKDKIIPLSDLSVYYMTKDSIKSLKFAKKAVFLSKKLPESKYRAYAYSSLGLAYAGEGKIIEAYSTIDSSMQYIKNNTPSSDIDTYAIIFSRIGLAKLTSEDSDGIMSIFTSLNLAKKSNNTKLQASAYSMLSMYYMFDKNNFGKYSKLALKNAEISKSPDIAGMTWMIKGITYLAYFEQNKEEDKLDNSISCLRKALDIYNLNLGYIKETNYSTVLDNLSQAYLFKNDIKFSQSNLDSISYFASHLINTKGDKLSLDDQVRGYNAFATVEIAKKNYLEAENYYLKALVLISKDSIFNKLNFEIYNQLATLYEKMNRPDLALETIKKSIKYYRLYYDEKYMKFGQLQNAKYELEKKEQEIQTKKKQNVLYIVIASVLFLSLVFLFFLFKFRIKYFKQHKIVLNREKKEAILLAEEKEKEKGIIKEEAKQKTEEVGKLQKEIIAKSMQVSYKSEILEKLRQDIQNSKLDTLALGKTINKEKIADGYFENFLDVINNIHPDFYSRLQKEATQKLTPLDLKYCVYIFMRIPTKEMGDLLYVEPKTVSMNKYRLKQKFGLSKDQDLDTFIQNIII